MTAPTISEADRLVLADEYRAEQARRRVELAMTATWSALVDGAGTVRLHNCAHVQIPRLRALEDGRRLRNGDRRERLSRGDASAIVGSWPL